MNRVAEVNELKQESSDRDALFWAVWSVVAAFGTYFCMYAFRKPFTAASFEESTVGGLAFKTVLITAQVGGYAISKFIGITVISEMPPHRRAVAILALIAAAELTLLLFGVIPRPWNAVCLIGNGLSLGMVFGLVLGFLEGRRSTEALTAGLCCSFILADGVMKSLGAWLLRCEVPEDWMPSVAGLIFLLPLGVCVAMLARIPPPTSQDQAERSERTPLTRVERWSLYRRYGWGLSMLVAVYLLVSILRTIRADFAPEIWLSLLGRKAAPDIYTNSEILVALGVLVINGSLVCVRDNRGAFFLSLAACGMGIGLMAVALIGLRTDVLTGFPFMVAIGLGLYLPYVAMHTTVFERFLAMTRERGNLGFLMYIADSIGYLGVVGVLVAKNLVNVEGKFVGYFELICWVATALAAVCLLFSWRYFAVRATASQVTAATMGEA